MILIHPELTSKALGLLIQERMRQDARWGLQDHPDGTGLPDSLAQATHAKHLCDVAFHNGHGTWTHILIEEVLEAMAETEPDNLKRELIQVAAVAVQWVECIERRQELKREAKIDN